MRAGSRGAWDWAPQDVRQEGFLEEERRKRCPAGQRAQPCCGAGRSPWAVSQRGGALGSVLVAECFCSAWEALWCRVGASNPRCPVLLLAVIQSLIALVNDPQPEHPLRADLAEEYSKDRKKFCKNAEEFTKKYGEKRPVD